MKPRTLILFILIVAATLIAASCHKKSTPAPPALPFHGLKGISHIGYENIGPGRYTTRIKWYFSGSGPVLVSPSEDTAYLGYMQVNYSGNLITQIAHHTNYPYTAEYEPLTASFIYGASNHIDSIIFQYTIYYLGTMKIAFQYNGDQITNAILARTPYNADTISWDEAAQYQISYNGNNISQIIESYYQGPSSPRYVNTYVFTSGSRLNNLASSIPEYVLQYFIENESNTDPSSLIPLLPYYTNPNIVESAGSPSYPNTPIINLLDASGRITQRILPRDTTLYLYY